MKTASIVTALLLGGVSLMANDASVKAPTEKVQSTKKTSSSGGSTGTISEKKPDNLRENPSENIPFADTQPRQFQEVPTGTRIRLGPMPATLTPMGPPKPEVKVEINKPAPVVDIPPRAVVEIPQATHQVTSAGQSYESTTAPFLQWIQSTKNADEIARSQREAYEQRALQEKMMKDAASADLFLNIRFPYVGNQDLPPSGGAVIYTLPQR